jgi:hypothetical protein
MHCYSLGDGHNDLATKLNIDQAVSLALPGTGNSRIIRTTLKDSYLTSEKTLYIVGLTFLKRTELPINAIPVPFEGRWLPISNYVNPSYNYIDNWNAKDTENFIKLKIKSELLYVKDALESLQYQVLSMITDLHHRGHQVVVFKNPRDNYNDLLDTESFKYLQNCVNIVDGLRWEAIPWQITQNIKFDPRDYDLDPGIRHPAAGECGPLNNFLVEYIKKHALYLPVL